MINFFRKIRQRFLTENNYTKYLLYALGEIVLVVIGILIALQLNLYKENQNNQKVEIDYLKGILNDIDQDIYDLNDLLFSDTLLFNSYTTILRAFTDKNIDVKSSSFIKAIGFSNTYHTYDGNSIIFEDMKSSGKINFVKSDMLRISMLKYFNDSDEEIKEQNEFDNPEMTKLQRNAFLTNIDLNSLIERFMFPEQWSAEIDELDLSFFQKDIKSKEVKNFANNISMMKSIVQSNNRAKKKLLYSAKDLKSQIIEYLNSKGVEIRNGVSKETLIAIKNGNTDILKKNISLEELNDCFYMEDESGNFLVHSITYKSLKSLQFFVEKGADIEGICENKTPLMYAIKYGEFEMVKYLVEKGANLKANNHGKSVLYYAKVYEHPEIEKYLVSKNAN